MAKINYSVSFSNFLSIDLFVSKLQKELLSYMWCLIVRQPYASLIAYGCKKWEFRSYNSTKRGTIAIASSRGTALKTASNELNAVAKHFPI